MGDFKNLAEKMANMLEELRRDGEVFPEDIAANIPEVIGEHIEGRPDDIEENIPEVKGSQTGGKNSINFYPYGKPGSGCCNFALFLSLQTSAYKKPRQPGHLNCGNAMEKIVRHMQGYCPQKTHEAVLITDFWDGEAFLKWEMNFQQIRKHANLEIYLLAGGRVSEINI